jgi:hypothetical protein
MLHGLGYHLGYFLRCIGESFILQRYRGFESHLGFDWRGLGPPAIYGSAGSSPSMRMRSKAQRASRADCMKAFGSSWRAA